MGIWKTSWANKSTEILSCSPRPPVFHTISRRLGTNRDAHFCCG